MPVNAGHCASFGYSEHKKNSDEKVLGKEGVLAEATAMQQKHMMAREHVIEKIREMADVVESDPRSRGVLSTSERIAVAVVLRRMDWLQDEGFEDVSKAFARLGDEWERACVWSKIDADIQLRR